ncbi:MAG: rane protein [Blastococcus sp.]|nr:rane protein [Blastococcus sp.]
MVETDELRHPAPPIGSPTRRKDRLRQAYRHWAVRLTLIFFISRLVPVTGFALAQNRERVPISWWTMMARWDGFWYIYLAKHGYPKTMVIPAINRHYGPWGFFPTWPWTIRLTHDVTRLDYPMAGALIVSLYGVAFILVLRVFAESLIGAEAADAAAVLVCFFPGTLVLSLAYTEASFLFWCTLAFVLLGKRRWGFAAAAVFMACVTRETGVALAAAAATAGVQELLHHRHELRRPRAWMPLLPAPAAALAFLLVGSFAKFRTGNALAWIDAEKAWSQKLDFGHGLYVAFTRTIPSRGVEYRHYTVQLVMLAFFVLIVTLAGPHLRRLPLPMWVYLIVSLISIFAFSHVGPRPRMLLTLFPLLVLAAATLKRMGDVWFATFIAISAVLTVVMAYAIMYIPWHVTA